MASIAKLVVSLGANTSHFETDMKRAAGISKRQMMKMERDAKRLNSQWNSHFKMAGLAVAAGLGLAAKSALEFEKAMAEVSTLLDDTSGLDNLAQSVKDLSVQFGQSPTEQAKALYQIISAGASDAATQMENLTAANKLAVGGVTDVETAADGLTTVLNAYAETGLDVNRISDIMFNTMKNGKTTVGELAGSIGNVATIAAATGVSFEEVGAAIGTLTKAGINTAQSMDALRGVLSAVLKQSDQSVKMASQLGVEFNATALEAKGLHKFLADIAATGATSEQLSKLFGRVEGLNAVMALGSQGGEEFTRQLESMAGAAGSTEIAVAKMAETTAFKVAQAKAAFQVLGIEIGTKFLASVSGLAVGFVKHIDAIAAAVQALVVLLTVRLAAGAVAAFGGMIVSAGGLATAFAFLGGPIGAAALALTGFILLINQLSKDSKNLEDMLSKQARVLDDLTDAWIKNASAAEIISKQSKLRREWIKADNELLKVENKIAQLLKETPDDLEKYHAGLKQLRDQQDRLITTQSGLLKGLGDTGKQLADITKETENTAKETIIAAKATDTLTASMKKARAAYAAMQIQRAYNARMERSNKLIAEGVELLDEIGQEIDTYEESLKSLLDTLNPVQAAGEEFGESLAIIARHAEEAGWSQDQLSDAVRRLTADFDDQIKGIRKTTDEFDLMATAIDEGIRILERTFTSLWEGLLSGSSNAFDTIKDGFKSLLANLIHQATTGKIILNIQQGLAGKNPITAANPTGGINFNQLGQDLAVFAAVIAGSALGGGGQAANTGASIGAIAGGIVGTAVPIIGTMLGSIIGGILGGLIGGIFDKKPRIGAGGFDIEPGDTKFFGTALGGVHVGDTRGGMDDFVDEFGAGIREFDKSISTFLDDDQFGAISEALKTWSTELRGDAVSIENILNSRFRAILDTFSDDIKSFVNLGNDLVSRSERLQVGATAETLFKENQGIFTGRTVADILAVVEAMRTGTETIGEAYNEFLNLLNIIVAVKTSLEEFVASDLGTDFQMVLDAAGLSLADALTGMTVALSDALLNFDGSPEQLQNIGLMVSSIREGELKLLAQIDAIQKGISANLAKLKADIIGIAEGPRSDAQLFSDAQGFINSISTASTAEEIAALERQFDAVIRAMSPEAQASNMSSILQMIDAFGAESDLALGAMTQAVLDSAASTRDMVQEFIDLVGDPLEIIARTNEDIAAALVSDPDSIGQSAVHEENIEGILETGVSDIASEVATIGPAVVSAIRTGLGGVSLNATIVTGSRGFTNE